MKPQLGDLQAVALDPIHHAVLVRDAARPEAREGVFQGFRLAHAAERLALRLADRLVDPLDHFAALLQSR